MKELGLFGVTIPEEYGGMGLDLTTYAMIVEELSRVKEKLDLVAKNLFHYRDGGEQVPARRRGRLSYCAREATGRACR